MSFRKLYNMTFRKLIPPFTLTGFGQDAFFKKKKIVCSTRITFFRSDDNHFTSIYVQSMVIFYSKTQILKDIVE